MTLDTSVWEQVRALCTSDLGADKIGLPRILEQRLSATSRIVMVALRAGEGETEHEYAVKLPRGNAPSKDWNPQREYEGLVTLTGCANGASWSTVPPVGFCLDPQLLVTRLVHGQALRPLIERGLFRWARERQVRASADLCDRLARCLKELRFAEVDANRPTGLTRSLYLDFCFRRLREISEYYGDRRTNLLCGQLESWLEQVVAWAWPMCRPLMARCYACHGDFSFQNVLLTRNESLCLVDLEGFRTTQFNEDYATFRFRLEHLHLNPMFVEINLLRCWRAFHNHLATTNVDEAYLLLSYVYKLLAHLAWLRNPGRVQRQRFRTSVRERLWARRRLAWLSRMRRSDGQAWLEEGLVGTI